MPVKVSINSTQIERVSGGLRLSQAKLKRINQAGADGALESIVKYYQVRGRNLWINPALPTHGAGRKATRWSDPIPNSWTTKKITGNEVVFENPTVGLAHKVEGGTIRPRRAKWLTIPLVPEAHGLTAREYSSRIAPLFRIKNVLAQQDTDIDGDGLKPVFALKKSVTHAKWKGALPPDSLYLEAFIDKATDEFADIIDGK